MVFLIYNVIITFIIIVVVFFTDTVYGVANIVKPETKSTENIKKTVEEKIKEKLAEKKCCVEKQIIASQQQQHSKSKKEVKKSSDSGKGDKGLCSNTMKETGVVSQSCPCSNGDKEEKTYKNLTELVIDIFSNIDFNDTKISFTLLDDKSNILISVNKDLALNQASVSKLIVSLAAMKYLGLNYKFKTNFYIDNEIDKDGVLDGNLIIKGFGDPNLLTEDIYKIIDFLKIIGLKEIKGNIIIDLSFFDKKYTIYKMKEEDESRAYAAFNNALPLNYNSFKFVIKPYIDEENEEKNKINVNISYPASLLIRLKNKLVLSKWYSRIKAKTLKAKYHNTKLELKGRVNKKINLLVFYRRIQNPDYYFGKIFFRMLKYSKIKVKGRLKLKYKNQIRHKKDIKLLYSYHTKYLLDTLIVMNRYSNNFIAEQLLKIIGAKFSKTDDSDGIGSWENGIKAVKEMLKTDIKISPDSYRYTNASGLNDANFFSSYQIARILYYVKNNFDYKWYLLSTLPKIGISGTLKRYCLSENCKGAVIAKTGSLRTTVALAGFINVSDKLHTFSLAVNFDSSKQKFRKILKQAKDLITNLTELENL